MTKFAIQGRNLEITEAVRDYAQQKLGKVINNFQEFATKVDVNLSVPRNVKGPTRQTSEVTVYASGTVIRAEEKHENLYASIDLVADKLNRQLKRYKDKVQGRSQRKSGKDAALAERLAADMTDDSLLPIDLTEGRTPELPATVVRSKFFAMPPMSIQDALDNLQLIDHDFYMFCNEQTGEINVIYERNHGGYGVIQPHKVGVS